MGDSRRWAAEQEEDARELAEEKRIKELHEKMTVKQYRELAESIRWLRNWHSAQPLTKDARDRIVKLCGIIPI